MRPPSKLTDRDRIAGRLAQARSAGRRIVFTNGCFDLIHPGHVSVLRRARALGDLLVLGLNSDRSIRELKGPRRPILDETERIAVLDALEPVDLIVVFDEPTPLELIRAVRPDVLVKGADWSRSQVVGREDVERGGGRVELLPLVEGLSTSALIERIVERFSPDRS